MVCMPQGMIPTTACQKKQNIITTISGTKGNYFGDTLYT